MIELEKKKITSLCEILVKEKEQRNEITVLTVSVNESGSGTKGGCLDETSH